MADGFSYNMSKLDETHDPRRKSFVASANQAGTDFPIQNLPFGVFRRRGSPESFRVGVAIGNSILDFSQLGELFDESLHDVVEAAKSDRLNGLMARGEADCVALRRALGALLDEKSVAQDRVKPHLLDMSDAQMILPVTIGDFTDFYASVFHATNAGRLMRPENPLLPNYKHLPVAYHSRVSSIRASGEAVRRPSGQLKGLEDALPRFGPSARLDYETELGVYIGTSSKIGNPIAIEEARRHVFGFSLLNDWSARDIQAWEYQPLGPFLAKNFATTLSPWVVTASALEPFRTAASPRGDDAPPLLAYLLDPEDQQRGGLSVILETYIQSASMRRAGVAPHLLSSGSFADTYWTIAQMVAHHTSGGCNLVVGDLLGSGTVSGPSESNWGSLLELSFGGKRAIKLPGGETRRFLEDGDEITIKGHCSRSGAARIGFGECRGVITAAGMR